MERVFNVHGKPVTIAVDQTGERVRVTVDGQTLEIDDVAIDDRYVTLRTATRLVRVPYARAGAHVHAALGGESYEFVPAEEIEEAGRGAGAFVPQITSPMPGKVLAIKVSVGDIVEADQALLLLEAMKMEQTVRAPQRSRVAEIRVQEAGMVGPGAVLMVLEEIPDGLG